MEVKRDILWRVYLCFLGIVVLAVAVLGRAAYIQQVQGSYWKSKSDSLHTKIVNLEAERGTIYSEDGSMLSTSIPFFDIYIDFGAEGLRDKNGKRFKENIDSLSLELAGLFRDQTAASYKKELEAGYRVKDRYYLLKKNISFDQYKLLRDFHLFRLGKNKSGFIADVKNKRLNPFGLLANRTIGLARENAQNVGLERTYDADLKGESGKKLVRFIAGGVAVPVEGFEVEAMNGTDIITTLDVNMQDIAEQALLKMMIDNECDHGTCIVMEVKTGKIKAIANLGRTEDGQYWENLNYGIRASEPGSTFKLMTMLAALEDKHITLDSKVDLEGGKWYINRRTVYDSERHGLGSVSYKEAFEHSSNVGMAKLAINYYAANPQGFYKHLEKLHLPQGSGIDLLGETKPIIKTPKSKTWSATTLPWMAFGYEVLISPLQTLMVYNAVANGGKLMKPYLVHGKQRAGVPMETFAPTVLEEKICSEATLKQLQECLVGVVENGTGKGLRNPQFPIAGKTGTALVANGSRGYADHIYQSSFAGYFPANDPRYSCIVVIRNKPHARKFYGAAVAGPVFKEVAEKLYALTTASAQKAKPVLLPKDSSTYFYAANSEDVRKVFRTLGMPYADSTQKEAYASVTPLQYRPVLQSKPITDKPEMPNLFGLGLRDALYVLDQKHIQVRVTGTGRVVAQSIPAGTTLNGQTIVNLSLD